MNVVKILIAVTSALLLLNCSKKEQSEKETPNIALITPLINEAVDNENPPKDRLKKVDDAIALSREVKNDSLEFEALKTKMYLLSELGMDDSALNLNYHILKRAKELDSKKHIANSYFLFGNYYYENYVTDSAYYYFNKSKDEFIKLNNKNGIAKNSINLAMILNDLASYFESEKLSLEALNYVQDDPKHPYLSPIFNNLAVSSGGLLNYKEELYWYDKALELTEDPYYVISINHNKAVAYTLLKDYDKAISILSELKDEPILKDHLSVKARILDNLSYAKWLKNKNANVLQTYHEAIDLFIETKDYFGLSTVYDHLYEYYIDTDKTKALEYANKILELSEISNNTEGKVTALKKIITINNNLQDIKKFIVLTDSLQFINGNTKYQFAKLDHDVDANRDKIKTLSLKNANNELNLQRAKISNIISIAAFIIAVIIFISYYYYIKNKRKIEQQQIIYETEVSISEKLHDELANDLFSTITLVESIPFDNPELKNKLTHNLDYIYAQTRKISRENSKINTHNFLDELNTMLASFQSDSITIMNRGINTIAWDKVNDQYKIILYRVLNELLVNMRKHSNCSLVIIKFEEQKNLLLIDYIDNGNTSIDLNKISKNGLKNMENRVTSISGEITFDTTKGFKAFIKIPKQPK